MTANINAAGWTINGIGREPHMGLACEATVPGYTLSALVQPTANTLSGTCELILTVRPPA